MASSSRRQHQFLMAVAVALHGGRSSLLSRSHGGDINQIKEEKREKRESEDYEPAKEENKFLEPSKSSNRPILSSFISLTSFFASNFQVV